MPFTRTKILDKRFDSSILGYTAKKIEKPSSKIKFKSSCADAIENYINSQYSFVGNKDTGMQLVVVLEKFWLSASFETGRKEKGETPVIQEDPFGGKQQVNQGVTNNRAVLLSAKLLGYANDNYYYIYAFDSVYLIKDLDIGHSEKVAIKFAIDEVLSKLVNKPLRILKLAGGLYLHSL